MRSLALGLALMFLAPGTAPAAGTPPGVADFFKPLAYPEMIISPDGTHVAVLFPSNGASNVAVIDLVNMKGVPLTAYQFPADVRQVFWKSNDRLVYLVDDYDHRRNHVRNIGAVNRDGGQHIMLHDNRDPVYGGYYTEDIVDLKIDDPGRILLGSQRTSPGYTAVYDTDAVSVWQRMRSQAESNRNEFATRRTKIASAPGRNCSYTVDLKGEVHAQQCAEKYLKALLVSRKIDPPKIHDLTELHALLPDGLLVEFDARLLEELNPYSIEGRYPGVWEPVEQGEALRAVEAARTIRQATRRILPPAGIV